MRLRCLLETRHRQFGAMYEGHLASPSEGSGWWVRNISGLGYSYFPVYQFEPVVEPKLDLTKPVQTRDGESVRILCIDGPSTACPVIGIFCNSIWRWSLDGQPFDGGEDRYRLINVPEKPVAVSDTVYLYKTAAGKMKLICEDAAQFLRKEKILGRKLVTIEEGEGMADCGGACPPNECKCT